MKNSQTRLQRGHFTLKSSGELLKKRLQFNSSKRVITLHLLLTLFCKINFVVASISRKQRKLSLAEYLSVA